MQNKPAVKADRTEIFENYPVKNAVFALALPTVLNQLATSIYNLVDTFFIGQTGNEYMVAAVSLGSVAMMIMTGVANLLGMGGGSLISRCLGAHEYERAKHVSSFCSLTTILFGVIFGILTILLLEPYARIMGASDQTVEYTKQYVFWTMGVGAVPTVFAVAIGNHIRSTGNSKHEMIGMVTGHVINCVLDPVLIFVFNLGVAGAAIATMVSNLIACIYYLYFIFKNRGGSVLNLNPANYRVDGKTIADIMLVGLPAALNTLINSASRIVLNNILASYGDATVAAMGIVRKIDELPMHIASGFTQGTMSLIGYNYAAKNYNRMEKCRRFSLFMTLSIGIASTILIELSAPVLIRVFIDKESVVNIGTIFLRIHAICLPIMGANFAIRSTFQAMGKGPRALFVTICRQGVIYIPTMYIMNALWQSIGVASAQIVADAISLGIAYLLYIPMRRQLLAEERLGKTL